MGFTKQRTVLTGFGAFLLAVLVFAVFFQQNFHTVVVRGDSMLPTLRPGQRVLVSKAYWLVGKVDRDDIVVVHSPEDNEVLIKRVQGLQGDSVDLALVPLTWKLAQGEYHVPQGMIYVVGDNRPVSQDSREYGPFEPSDVIGKVVIFGNEPWMVGFLVVAVGSLVATYALGRLTRAKGTAV